MAAVGRELGVTGRWAEQGATGHVKRPGGHSESRRWTPVTLGCLYTQCLPCTLWNMGTGGETEAGRVVTGST